MSQLDFGILLAVSYQEFVRQMHLDLAERGFDDLGRSDGYVFRALADSDLNTSQLAERLAVTKQAAGQIVDDLARRGYVTHRADPADRRARLLELTDRGERALAAARSFHKRYERKLVRRCGADALSTVREVLGSMAPEDHEGRLDPRLRALYL